VITLYIIRKFLCSLIILVLHSKWREAQPFISLLRGFASRLNELALPPTERMSESEVSRLLDRGCFFERAGCGIYCPSSARASVSDFHRHQNARLKFSLAMKKKKPSQ